MPIKDILGVSLLSHYWQSVSQKDSVWKPVFAYTFPEQNHFFSADFKKHFIKSYKERDIRWDETFNSKLAITENGTRVEHKSGGVYYTPLRTRRGFRSGRHYWEVKYVNCTLSSSLFHFDFLTF